ncbi:DNA polymerase II large subunit [Nanoarchaeota archaeon]
MQKYFKEIENKVKVAYSLAGEARRKGYDPVSAVEIPLATSLAERVTGLISTKYAQLKDDKIVKRIRELETQYSMLDPAVAFKISEEVSKEKFCKFKDKLEAIDAGIRIGLAYLTLGVVSSPLEGFTHFKLKKTEKGEDFFSIFFSGPIRSAGGTAAATCVVLADYLRENAGYARYDPTEAEVNRTVTELYDYHERVTNLQYLPTEKEIKIIASNLPIQINGDPSEKFEVSNFKDLPRIETNIIRNGVCLVTGEGVALKAAKLLKIVRNLKEKGFVLTGWDWLSDLAKMKKVAETKPEPSAVYIKDLVAGRPVLTHPSRSGGFRLRYGRARNSGFSATSIHPASMVALDNFIAIGTQLRTERPGKSTVVTSCDTIEGPIIKLKDGSVVVPKTYEEAKEIKKDILEILYLGDILISYGDFFNRNYPLMPCGYNEEWWGLEVEEKKGKVKDFLNVSFEEAVEFSKKYDVSLYPKYTFYWSQVNHNSFMALLKVLKTSKLENGEIVFDYVESVNKAKRCLEILGVPHLVKEGRVIIDKENSKYLLLNLGVEKLSEVDKMIGQHEDREGVLNFLNSFLKIKIADKAGTFVGSRMGRPEKAKMRKLIGSPHTLFPVGQEGGRFRSVQEAAEHQVTSEFPIHFCETCKKETIYFICEDCGNKTKKLLNCPKCERNVTEVCPEHGGLQAGVVKSYMRKKVDIGHYLQSAAKLMNIQKHEIPPLIKGTKGILSSNRIPEHLAKGILRAQYAINVNKDGTARYDATELPITHFKPCEVGTSIPRLIELGYTKDAYGKKLERKDQILEIFPQDIILPDCPETPDIKASEAFLKVAKFMDNLLVRLYGLKPFYNASTKEDLTGHLMVCIAPHNAAGVVARVIGFSHAQALLASPYMHGAMRRDADGDEAAFMLLLDTLINFSREYLSTHRGATQDCPIILNARIRAGEVDDMVFNIDVTPRLPLELYRAAQEYKPPHSVKVEQISDRLGKTDSDAFKNLWFSHDTTDMNYGAICSAYKTLATMAEKVEHQMKLAEIIRAVDTTDTARLVIERHFIRDTRGNLRKFSSQQFRCIGCNAKFRRPPLVGKCTSCGGKIIFTISKGSIIKYLDHSLNLAKNYSVSDYLKQSLDLTKSFINSIFGKDIDKQVTMKQWFGEKS